MIYWTDTIAYSTETHPLTHFKKFELVIGLNFISQLKFLHLPIGLRAVTQPNFKLQLTNLAPC